ncbi:MAG: carbamoyltransferase HypF [Candidatus Promineifilaceae bacterium]|nr:carbamoyltransferase HypF [Candidatus Promineifilaceae bacterium]
MSTIRKSEHSQDIQRQKIIVTGVVQGVGFRPFVYGQALEHRLAGFVGNDSGGVFIEVEGTAEALASFRTMLESSPPPLAHIETVKAEPMPVQGQTQFTIVQSQAQQAKQTLISPDICTCEDCLAELFDATDRRFRYPFINCTNCGPRFTIIKDIPYDRPLTTMADFTMCDECLEEYENPLNRRFHAQPNACPVCGPKVWLEVGEKDHQLSIREENAVEETRELLTEGRIVAVKGLGGFHLACDAANDQALETLRKRKGRVDKPFAVMALDAAAVRRFAFLSDRELQLLTSKERPILLLRKKESNWLSQLIAPGNSTIGVMLPYTPLHYLLLQPMADRDQPTVLVMTSGNFSNEPIVKDNQEARKQLSDLADAFLFHNRDIHSRCDDSVLRLPPPTDRIPSNSFLPLRRSRGYAPFPVKLPSEVDPLLAVGGELKSTLCLAHGNYAYLSQHIGDMENLETLTAFEAVVNHFQHIFRLKPQFIACDMHPRYLSSRWAEEQTGLPVVKVQHHHAHIASVMAENGLDGSQRVLGFSFDGTGYGPDGAVWGGEVLLANYEDYDRRYHLAYLPLVGGDVAVERPYRLALAYLHAVGFSWDERLPPVAACPQKERLIIQRQLRTGLNVIPTSSMGRLFDAVAAIAGVRQTITYEAQAAIELESLIDRNETGSYQFELIADTINVEPLLRQTAADVLSGTPIPKISARFHNAVVEMVVRISLEVRDAQGINHIALSGGVFQNISLIQKIEARLARENFKTFTHHQVPPNDGGLALGQAVIAAAVV